MEFVKFTFWYLFSTHALSVLVLALVFRIVGGDPSPSPPLSERVVCHKNI